MKTLRVLTVALLLLALWGSFVSTQAHAQHRVHCEVTCLIQLDQADLSEGLESNLFLHPLTYLGDAVTAHSELLWRCDKAAKRLQRAYKGSVVVYELIKPTSKLDEAPVRVGALNTTSVSQFCRSEPNT